MSSTGDCDKARDVLPLQCYGPVLTGVTKPESIGAGLTGGLKALPC
jgi:hypothetical protein